MSPVQQEKKRLVLPQDAPVHSCYGAGRGGWWLHRWPVEHGVHNIVVESSSIEVNRRAWRAKNDRPDADGPHRCSGPTRSIEGREARRTL